MYELATVHVFTFFKTSFTSRSIIQLIQDGSFQFKNTQQVKNFTGIWYERIWSHNQICRCKYMKIRNILRQIYIYIKIPRWIKLNILLLIGKTFYIHYIYSTNQGITDKVTFSSTIWCSLNIRRFKIYEDQRSSVWWQLPQLI